MRPRTLPSASMTCHLVFAAALAAVAMSVDNVFFLVGIEPALHLRAPARVIRYGHQCSCLYNELRARVPGGRTVRARVYCVQRTAVRGSGLFRGAADSARNLSVRPTRTTA